jgi:hypothetical protein
LRGFGIGLASIIFIAPDDAEQGITFGQEAVTKSLQFLFVHLLFSSYGILT